jgi:hypothetical protein
MEFYARVSNSIAAILLEDTLDYVAKSLRKLPPDEIPEERLQNLQCRCRK